MYELNASDLSLVAGGPGLAEPVQDVAQGIITGGGAGAVLGGATQTASGIAGGTGVGAALVGGVVAGSAIYDANHMAIQNGLDVLYGPAGTNVPGVLHYLRASGMTVNGVPVILWQAGG